MTLKLTRLLKARATFGKLEYHTFVWYAPVNLIEVITNIFFVPKDGRIFRCVGAQEGLSL